ncbi:MAG: NADH-quinone oxidoreductase subunit C [Deltaproteobacteria bacterium]
MELKETILKNLKERFTAVNFEEIEFRGELTLTFDKKYVVEVCSFLKENPDLQFNMCIDVTAIDWAKRKNRFTVVYQIYSLNHKFRLRLKCNVDESDCNINSVSSVWKSANWYERETYDMYGISFNNHPDLRRILTHEAFQGHPLRIGLVLQLHGGGGDRNKNRGDRPGESLSW